jgi:hypothetical protein
VITHFSISVRLEHWPLNGAPGHQRPHGTQYESSVVSHGLRVRSAGNGKRLRISGDFYRFLGPHTSQSMTPVEAIKKGVMRVLEQLQLSANSEERRAIETGEIALRRLTVETDAGEQCLHKGDLRGIGWRLVRDIDTHKPARGSSQVTSPSDPDRKDLPAPEIMVNPSVHYLRALLLQLGHDFISTMPERSRRRTWQVLRDEYGIRRP